MLEGKRNGNLDLNDDGYLWSRPHSSKQISHAKNYAIIVLLGGTCKRRA